MTSGAPVLLLGASGSIGQFLIKRLAESEVTLLAVSRRQPAMALAGSGVIWMQHDLDQGPLEAQANVLVGLGPIRHVLEQVRQGRGIGRVVAMSSASTLFKAQSPDAAERALMTKLIELEDQLEAECRERDIDLTLLKPALIYAPGLDANVSRVAGLIARLRVVPYCGRGLRQPVHADDLARLVVDCLLRGRATVGRWLLGGGETLAYPDMLRRIAERHGQPARLVPVPASLMKVVLKGAHAMGRVLDIRPVMLDRQKIDLVVDDAPARERLGWDPRPFRP